MRIGVGLLVLVLFLGALLESFGQGRATGRGSGATTRTARPAASKSAPSPGQQFFDVGMKCAKTDLDCRISNFTKAANLGFDSAELFVERSDAFYAKGEIARSIADLDKAIRKSPNDASLYRALAARYESLFEIDLAIAKLGSAIELEPKDTSALKHRAKLHALKGAYDLAVNDLTRSIKISPTEPELYIERAQIHLVQRDLERALEDYNKLLELSPDSVEFLRRRAELNTSLRKYPNATQDYSKLLAMRPGDGSVYLLRSSLFEAQGNTESAMLDLDKASQLSGADPGSITAKARLLERAGKYQESLAEIEKALKIDPKSVDAFIIRGLIHHRNGAYKAALSDFNNTLNIEPDEYSATIGRIKVLARLYRYSDALLEIKKLEKRGFRLPKGDEVEEAYICAQPIFFQRCVRLQAKNAKDEIAESTRLIGLDQRNARAYFRRGIATFRLPPEDARNWTAASLRSLGDFQKVLELDPSFTEAWYWIGVAYAQHGYPPGPVSSLHSSLEAYQKSLDLDPSDPEKMAAVGTVLARLGRISEGKQWLSRAHQASLNEASLQMGIGLTAIVYLKDFDLAVTSLGRSVELGNIFALQWLANAYAEKKRPDLAAAAFSKAIGKDPSNPELFALRARAAIWIDGDGVERWKPISIANLRKALELDTNNPFRYAELAAGLQDYSIGVTPAATERLSLMTKAIDLEPGEASFYADRARIYKNNFNDVTKATADVEKAIQLDPANSANYRSILS